MEKRLLIIFTLLSSFVFAQPVIGDGNNIPGVGYSAAISVSNSSNVGAAGANQTWDFSSLFFIPIGTMNVIQPSSSSMTASFPNANLAYTLAGTTSFFSVSATQFEVQAYAITSPGSGDDYSPNPRTLLKFPFSYQDTHLDTCQKSGAAETPLTLTYDAYGTLIMPDVTYTNVVRIKEDYGNGVVDYEWYTLNPLIILMQYRQSSGNLYFTEVTQVTTGAEDHASLAAEVTVYPNPAKDKLRVDLPDVLSAPSSSFRLYTVLGETMIQTTLVPGTNEINLEGIARGVYFYTAETNKTISSGKLVVE